MKKLADSYTAVGFALLSPFQSEEANKYVDLAGSIAEEVFDNEEKKVLNYVLYLRNLEGQKVALGRDEAAKLDVDLAEEFEEAVYDANSHCRGE